MQTRPISSRVPPLWQQLGLGVVLGLFQLFLFLLGFSRFGLNLQLNISFLPGLVLYLVFGALAGLLTARREGIRGAKAGGGTGCIATVVVLLALVLALLLNPPHAQVPSRFPMPLASIVVFLIFLVGFLNAAGTLLAMLGGVIGRAAGRRWTGKRSPLS